MSRIFKTICHNNIHRDYTNELIKITSDPTKPALLWKDSRPTYEGELKIIASKSINDLQFHIIDIVVGEEYSIQIKDGFVSIAGMDYMVALFVSVDPKLTADDFDEYTKHIMLSEIDRPDGIFYKEFFYSEEEMRDRKISEIIG